MDEFQETAQQLTLKAMEGLANTKEARAKVAQVSDEQPTEQEVEECATLSAMIKDKVEQVQKEHDTFKAKLNTPSSSS